MLTATLQALLLTELREHPLNPRKTFDEASLADLVESVRTHGVLTPLFVRKNGKGYEILAGHRRFRAAQRVGLKEVPAIVQEFDDKAALEIMVLDNLQRDDLHPLEESAGYASLMKDAGYDVERIAARINRSEKYVYDRIKLLQLIPELRKIFIDGEITAGHAILLARLSAVDQKHCLEGESRYGQLGGLFQVELTDQSGLDLDDRRKAVSVRELETWINDNVRFKPDAIDLPNLFPETNAALKAAIEEELKIVKITRDYRVNDAARDEKERTYGSESWKRADGQPEPDRYGKAKVGKPCDHSVLGIVVAGPGRGDAFPVCVAKKKCTVHWAAEQKAANERGAPNGAGTKKGMASAKDTWQQQEARRREQQKVADAERARWKKAAPRLREALVEKVTGAPIATILDVVIDQCKSRWGGPAPKGVVRGSSLEDGVRYAAFVALEQEFRNEWSLQAHATSTLKRFGVDAKKIVDEAAPAVKPEKKPKAKAATKKKAAKP